MTTVRVLGLVLLLLGLVEAVRSDAFNQSEVISRDIYRVYRIYLRDWRDVRRVTKLRDSFDDHQLDWWREARKPGHYSDVMVGARLERRLRRLLDEFSLQHKITIDDVRKLIEKEHQHKPSLSGSIKSRHKLRTSLDAASIGFARRFHDSPIDQLLTARAAPMKAIYPFGEYTSYARMTHWLRTVVYYHPDIARIVRIGTTHEGRPIEGLKIGYPIANRTKRVVWIDGGIHAREWASIHTALFIINQLIAGYGSDPQTTQYIDSLNFVIVPNINPDGYEYSRSSLAPEPFEFYVTTCNNKCLQQRLWRKNRSPERCEESRWGGWFCCQGVDLNRNFDFHFAETGTSSNPCSPLFAGDEAFSEPETRSVRNFLTSDPLRGKVDAFISLHTYGQLWLHPYSHEKQIYPTDIKRIQSLAKRAVKRLKNVYGTNYEIGTGADLLAPASGGSDDWAKKALGIRHVYLLELRPENEYQNGFILNQDELIPTGIETTEALKEIFDAVLEENGIEPRGITPLRHPPTPPPQPPTTLITSTSRPHNSTALFFLRTHTTTSIARGWPLFNMAVGNRLVVQTDAPPTPSTTRAIPVHTINTPPTVPIVEPIMQRRLSFPPTTKTTPSTTTKPMTTLTTSTPSTTTKPTTTTTASTTTSIDSTTTSTTTTTTTTMTTTSPTTTAESPTTTGVGSVSLIDLHRLFGFTNSESSSNIVEQSSTTTMATSIEVTPTTVDTTTQTLTVDWSQSLVKTSTSRADTSTISSRMTTSSRSSASSLASRVHGPRFLTPPPSYLSRRSPTPLSFAQLTRNTPGLPPMVIAERTTTPLPFILTSRRSSTCRDRKYSCVFWLAADPGACSTQRAFMERNCALSCHLCPT